MRFNAGIAQLVEHNLAKVGVASSSLVSRSMLLIPFRRGRLARYRRWPFMDDQAVEPGIARDLVLPR